MPTNNFVPVAAAAGSNVTADASWNGSSFQVTGVQKGIVPSAGMNKAWRQGTMGTSALGQIIVDHGLVDAVDDGNVPGLKANLRMAMAAMLAGASFAADQSNTANLITVILDPVPPALSSRGIFVRVANTNTGAVTLNFNSLGSRNVLKKNGAALSAGDIVQGQYVHLLFDTTLGQWVVAGSVQSDIRAIISGQGRVPVIILPFVAGATTWTCPSGVFAVYLKCWGAGGGGGGVNGAAAAGSGGAGGGYAEGWYNVTPGTTYNVIVGAGGAGGIGGSSPGQGGTGGTSSFASFITGPGGTGGYPANGSYQNTVPPGVTGSGGQFNYPSAGGGVGLPFGNGYGGQGGYTFGATGGPASGQGGFPGGGGGGGNGNGSAGGNPGGPGSNGLIILSYYN